MIPRIGRRSPVWVLNAAVVALHEQLIAEFGGSPGVRDDGLLDSALELTGLRLSAGEVDALITTLGLAARDIDEHRDAEWLAANTRPPG